MDKALGWTHKRLRVPGFIFLTMTMEWAYYVNRGKELRAFAAVVGAYGQYMLLIRYFV